MTEISFYHLQSKPLEKALPQLLEKVVQTGQRAVVLASLTERVDRLNALLWTYSQGTFLPHGAAGDGDAGDQPIFLTSREENPNGATILVLVDGAQVAQMNTYDRCLDLFDGNDQAAVAAARERWQAYKAAGHNVTYWQQTPTGGWEKKAG